MIINYSRSLWRSIKKQIRYLPYKKDIPLNPKHDDIYIVEFPKSGVTWLSFIMANILLKKQEINEQVTFYNIHKYIPDVHHLRGSEINDSGDYRFIKSHATYNPYYYLVVYLLRNPVDVMVSYYNFERDKGHDVSFDSFVRSEQYGISAWCKHVNGWLNNEDIPQRISLVRYEDLRNNTYQEIKNLTSNLGMNISDNIVKDAIELSNLENMKKSEELYRENNPNYHMSFVGKKNKIRKEEIVNSEILEYISDYCKKEGANFYDLENELN